MGSDDRKDGCVGTLLSCEDLAKVLACSTRHVRRQSDSGAIPPPLRIGRLVRWDKNVIDAWIAAGCRRVRTPGAGRKR
jgi:predicted DNA-binding transcriptional regulator AlpA